MINLLTKFIKENKDISPFFEGYKYITGREDNFYYLVDYSIEEIFLYFSSFPLEYTSYEEYKYDLDSLFENLPLERKQKKDLLSDLKSLYSAKTKKERRISSSSLHQITIDEYYFKDTTIEQEKLLSLLIKQMDKEYYSLFKEILQKMNEQYPFVEEGNKDSIVLLFRYIKSNKTELEPVTCSSPLALARYIYYTYVKPDKKLRKYTSILCDKVSKEELYSIVNIINEELKNIDSNQSILIFSSLKEAGNYLINAFLDDESLNETLFTTTLSKRINHKPSNVIKSL